ncbi:hypothetical protein BDV95DRAFT_609254 [Massariosphaeria phaeospora]|uniref:Uncharacterized protein n=1 Tax=Massariosphaeria phaeospora TaxID=100035 RepID=A0A7C8MBI5_9PLEO|nr:hypothetical protein BDV95DRAFT_609254 [Massariosphaeria phaeospora]
MQFSTIFAAVVSMAALAFAAPIANDEVASRQNHGMCVKGTAGTVEQIPNC